MTGNRGMQHNWGISSEQLTTLTMMRATPASGVGVLIHEYTHE